MIFHGFPMMFHGFYVFFRGFPAMFCIFWGKKWRPVGSLTNFDASGTALRFGGAKSCLLFIVILLCVCVFLF